MKLFGIGLPRTATTSLSLATLELGMRTCHTVFDDAMYEKAEAFFDTPVWLDYPALDARFPGSKFVYSWRNPDRWLASFMHHLSAYLEQVRREGELHWNAQNARCYLTLFGKENSMPTLQEHLLACYHHHRQKAEEYFRGRDADFLMLDIDGDDDPWWLLGNFLGKTTPVTPFPVSNTDSCRDWDALTHPLMVTEKNYTQFTSLP